MKETGDQQRQETTADRDRLLAQARQACVRKDFATAFRLYDALLERFPANADVLLDYGRATYLEYSDLEKAARLFLEVLKIDPDCLEALLWLGEVCAVGYGPGYEKAVEFYSRAIALDPTCVDAYIGLGMMYGAPSSHVTLEEAIHAYRTAMELAPSRHDTHMNLGFALLKSGQSEHGQQELLKAAQLLRLEGKEEAAQGLEENVAQARQGRLKTSAFINASPRFQWPEES
jgi:tetratricopeptide (TPR) repeat protein